MFTEFSISLSTSSSKFTKKLIPVIDSKSSIVEANVLSGFLDGLFSNRKAMPSIDGFVMSSKARNLVVLP